MNPLWQWMITWFTLAELMRRCPKCHHKQIVARERLRESVLCRRCGADIPPKLR